MNVVSLCKILIKISLIFTLINYKNFNVYKVCLVISLITEEGFREVYCDSTYIWIHVFMSDLSIKPLSNSFRRTSSSRIRSELPTHSRRCISVPFSDFTVSSVVFDRESSLLSDNLFLLIRFLSFQWSTLNPLLSLLPFFTVPMRLQPYLGAKVLLQWRLN